MIYEVKFYFGIVFKAPNTSWVNLTWGIPEDLKSKNNTRVKCFHFLFTVCFIYNLFFIHTALSLMGNQSWSLLSSYPCTFNSASSICSICLFSLCFWDKLDNSTINQIVINQYSSFKWSISWIFSCFLFIFRHHLSYPASLLAFFFIYFFIPPFGSAGVLFYTLDQSQR